ncbi:unnamed protein product, partial [Acanthoscelides obtectus]
SKNASETETQHSSKDRENIIQESPKIEQNGSKKAVKRKSKETDDDATLAKAIKVMERPVDDFQIFGDYSYLIRKKLVPYQQHRFQSRLYLQYMTQVAQIHSLFIHCNHTIIPILINFNQHLVNCRTTLENNHCDCTYRNSIQVHKRMIGVT